MQYSYIQVQCTVVFINLTLILAVINVKLIVSVLSGALVKTGEVVKTVSSNWEPKASNVRECSIKRAGSSLNFHRIFTFRKRHLNSSEVGFYLNNLVLPQCNKTLRYFLIENMQYKGRG